MTAASLQLQGRLRDGAILRLPSQQQRSKLVARYEEENLQPVLNLRKGTVTALEVELRCSSIGSRVLQLAE